MPSVTWIIYTLLFLGAFGAEKFGFPGLSIFLKLLALLGTSVMIFLSTKDTDQNSIPYHPRVRRWCFILAYPCCFTWSYFHGTPSMKFGGKPFIPITFWEESPVETLLLSLFFSFLYGCFFFLFVIYLAEAFQRIVGHFMQKP